MSRSARSRLHELQHRVYRSLVEEVDELLGPPPPSIRRYERAFRRELGKGAASALRSLSKDKLIAAIRDSQVTLIGDFHTYPQAQRTALRLAREAILPGESWMIGLELVPSSSQEALEQFQAGELSLAKFHETIRYAEDWGFPWVQYAPIFEWARANGVPILGLNRPRSRGSASMRSSRGLVELRSRDEWAAQIIAARLASGKTSRVLALYGDLHLGSTHLPQALRAHGLEEPLRVHQNQERLYWELAKRGRAHSAQILSLGKKSFCVFSGTPWAKLQSLVSWAEGEQEEEWQEADDARPVDYLSLMRTYGNAIAELLDLRPADFSSLTLRTAENADFVDRAEVKRWLARSERAVLRRLVGASRRVYVPGAKIAFLATPSLNGAAELAALHLWRAQTGDRAFFEPSSDDFFRATLEAAFGFFGSLVINPRRKCELLEDHSELATTLRPGRQAESHRLAAEILAVPARARLKQLRKLAGLRKTRQALSRVLAARYIGAVAARRLHQALISGSLGPAQVRALALPNARKAPVDWLQAYVNLVDATQTSAIGTRKNSAL